MIEKVTNNFWWKLLSVALAFLLWLVVVNVEDPLTTRVFYDIPVNKLNVEIIEQNKKAIEYLDGETVTVKVKGKRSIVDRMSSSDINAYADLERKSITGAIDIEIEVPESLSVMEKEPTMMMIELESIVTVQKEVQPYMEGEPGEGYIYLDPVVTPNNIEVEGPESKIALIKSVLVPVKIGGVTRDVTLYGSPQIIDESNNVIKDLKISANQVQIQVPIEKVKVVNLKEIIDRTTAEGYELISLTLSQDKLKIRGKANVIDTTDALTISGLDLSALTEDTILSVNVISLLTSGLNVYEDVNTIEIFIDVEPIVEKSFIVTHDDINVRRLADDLTFSYVDEESYTITFKGIAAKLEEIDIERLSPSISLSDLDEGIHEAELSFYTPVGVELITERPLVIIELSVIEVVPDTLNEDGSIIGDEKDTTNNP